MVVKSCKKTITLAIQKTIYLFIFSLSLAHLSTQSILNVKVVDAHGIGLASVSVFIPELEKTTITDESGNYSFEHPEKGMIRIRCPMLGYRTHVQIIDLHQLEGEVVIQLETESIFREDV